MKTLLTLSFTLLSFTSIYAQNRGHTSKYYGVEQGLPTTEVFWVIKSKQDYMWFGTDVGVSRFDGYSFKNYTTKDGLTDHTIFHVYEDPFERIWFLPFNNQLGYIKNDSVFVYKYNETIKNVIGKGKWIQKIIIDANDNLMFIITDGTVGMVDVNGNLTIEDETERTQNELIYSEFGDEKFYKLLRNESNKESKAIFIDELRGLKKSFDFNFHTVLEECQINENASFLLSKGSVIYIDQTQIRTIELENLAFGITINKKGNLWIQVINKGILIYENIDAFFDKKEPIYQLFNGQDITCVLHGDNGELWVCTENNGVYYFQNENIDTYSFSKVPNGNKVTQLVSNKKKEVFYANTIGEVFMISLDNKHTKIDSGYGHITNMDVDEDYKMTISTYGKSNFDKKYFNSTNNSAFIGRTFLKTKNNDFWKVLPKSVALIRDGKTIFDSEKKMENFFFHAVFEDSKGQIWTGGNEGLYLFSNNELIPVKSPFRNEIKVKCINQLKNETMLITTASRGVFLLNKNNEKYSTINLGFENYSIKDIHIDSHDNIWLSTNRGVIIISEITSKSFRKRIISQVHGLPSNEVNKVLTDENTVYVATNKGLAIFDRAILVKNKQKIKIWMEDIKVNERSISKNSAFTLKSTENYIEFFYTGILYRNAGKTAYAYKLDGIDTKWQYTKARSVRYPFLPPNDYVFSVKAANEDNIWSDTTIIRFIIHPPFWQEKSFVLICFLLGTLILFLVNRKVKTNRKAKQEGIQELEKHKRKIIEAELKALRAQMNPHFTFNTLNSIQSFITKFDREKANKYISEFSLLLRKVLENSRFRTITIDEEVEMLKLYLNLENLRFKNSINYKIIIDSNLESCFEKIPSMVIQPFVENAIIHGLSGKKNGEKRLTIELIQKENHILCVVEDSGIGRKKAAENRQRKGLNHESLGMKITGERLKLFNKDDRNNLSFSIIDLSDENGQAIGTRVEIIFKLFS